MYGRSVCTYCEDNIKWSGGKEQYQDVGVGKQRCVFFLNGGNAVQGNLSTYQGNDYPGSGERESFKEHLFAENPAFLESVEHTRILDQCIQDVKEDVTTVSALPR